MPVPLYVCLFSMLQCFVISASTECRLRPCTGRPAACACQPRVLSSPSAMLHPIAVCGRHQTATKTLLLTPNPPSALKFPCANTPHAQGPAQCTPTHTPTPTALLLPQQALLTRMHTRSPQACCWCCCRLPQRSLAQPTAGCSVHSNRTHWAQQPPRTIAASGQTPRCCRCRCRPPIRAIHQTKTPPCCCCCCLTQ